MTKIHDLTVLELAAAIRSRELSPVEITAHYLGRIEALNSDVGAFYTVTADAAREQAAEAEKAVARASDPAALPPLTGVPIPIKDLNMVAGVRQTLGSLVYEDNVPDESDHVSAALRAAGAVMPGKTATPEFGLPCYTETKIGPPARTPWDLSRSAGGSSGGAGAAVAAGLAPAAQGSDGGGSIRIPSSVCGLFGIKPTRGRISSAPLVPDLFGLGIDGPLARTVADAALLLDVMTGNQDGDMYTLPPLPAGETFLGHASRDARRAADRPLHGARGRGRRASIPTAWPPTRTRARCSPASGTRSSTWTRRSARMSCPRSRPSGTRWPRWRRWTPAGNTCSCRSPATCATRARKCAPPNSSTRRLTCSSWSAGHLRF